MHFSERSYYVFGDQSTFLALAQNGTKNQGTLFTVDEERDGDFDSVSEYDRDSNNYAPMSFPPPPPPPQQSQQQQQQPPGLTFANPHNLHSHQPKIYSNVVVGIGGPASEMMQGSSNNNGNYHHSSSSSNVTSNSTSTTSQNTTATTSTSALGI